jgi:hypothetical protein
VVHEVRIVSRHEHGIVSGPFPARAPADDRRASSREHGIALGVEIGPEDVRGAADHDAVRALRASTTQVKRREHVVIPGVLHEKGSLDRAAVSRGECTQLSAFASAGSIEPNHLDPAPKAAERQPRLTVSVDDEVGIDRVPIIRGA